MLELFVLCGILIAVGATLEHNHQRTGQLSRTPFALDLEVDGSADRRRAAADLWSQALAGGGDGALGGRREATATVAAGAGAPRAGAPRAGSLDLSASPRPC